MWENVVITLDTKPVQPLEKAEHTEGGAGALVRIVQWITSLSLSLSLSQSTPSVRCRVDAGSSDAASVPSGSAGQMAANPPVVGHPARPGTSDVLCVLRSSVTIKLDYLIL